MRHFGILYLDDKRTDIDAKGNHLKKFKSFYDNNEYTIKTKRKEMHRTYAIINYNDFSVNEYITNDILDEHIFSKMASCNWSQKINRIDLNMEIDYNKLERINYFGNIISIDPTGCSDIDDAINYKINNDNIEIGIHIADPSSYIDINSDVGKELLNRCESVYLDKTHHMIPEHFGIKNISLLQAETKRAFSLILNINTNNIQNIGECIRDKNYEYKFIKTYITVNKNLSYNEFEQTLNNLQTLNNNQKDYYKEMYDIGKQISIGLNIYDDDNYDSHKMVEAYMILCNHLAANHTFIKRANTVKKYNIINSDDNSKLNNNSKLYKICYQNAAIYTTDDKIHEGLNLKYTHFTSPMRRVIDFVNHIIINSNYNLVNSNYNFKNLINLDKINQIHKYYKKIYNIRNIDKLLGGFNNKKYSGTIIFIDDNKITVNINNNFIYIKVYDNKLLENNIIKIIEKTDTYIIFEYKDSFTRYELFQNIDIEIYRQKLEFNPFRIIINNDN